MSTVRLCVCPCGHLSVQEIEEEPVCHSCGTYYAGSIDWFNLDLATLVEDLELAKTTLKNFKKNVK